MNPWLLRTVAFLHLLAALPVSGQEPGSIGSRFLSTDSWTYEAIERLRTRGRLAGLNPLSQPYRRIDVAAELASLDPAALDEPSATWVRQLQKELAPERLRLGESEGGEAFGFELVAGATGADSRRRDPVVPYYPPNDAPNDESLRDRVWALAGGSLWLETHNVAAETRMYRDWWRGEENGDPDGSKPGGYADKAYLAVAFSWGDLWFGRLGRNWGPVGQTGLMIGDNPTAYPQVGLDVGRARFTLQFMGGELEPLEGRRRYIVANRLSYGTPDLWISVGEAVLYSGDASLLHVLKPLEILLYSHNANENAEDDRALTGNVMLNAMFWARRGPAAFYGEFVLDDFDLNPRIGSEERPVEATSYHLELGGRYVGFPALELGLDYRRISGWSYRSGRDEERWTYLERGLGDPWSDYDRVTLRADVFPSVPGLRVGPVVQVQRKGEGDYRDPFPADLLGRPGIFHGVTETTRRVALQGRYQPVREVFVEWDLGRSFISNQGHEEGVSEGRFSFLAQVAVTLAWSGGASPGG